MPTAPHTRSPVVQVIHEEMGRQHISITTAAEQAGIRRETLSRYLNGIRPLPIDTAQAIAGILGMKLSALFKMAEDRPEP